MEWISVKDRLPETTDDVLCLYEYRAMGGTHEGEILKRYCVGYYVKQTNTWGGGVINGYGIRVIAWTPIIEPSEEILLEKE